jgi:hypothetical protein
MADIYPSTFLNYPLHVPYDKAGRSDVLVLWMEPDVKDPDGPRSRRSTKRAEDLLTLSARTGADQIRSARRRHCSSHGASADHS